MPQDPNLYGQRPPKKQKREIPLSSSLAFTSQLTSLLSTPTSTSTTPASASLGRVRPSKSRKDDIFSVKTKRKEGSSRKSKDDDDEDREASDDERRSSRLVLKDTFGTEEEKQDFARARRKMEHKARLYAAMKRGDYVAKDNEAAPLVDFDRKWAEKHPEANGGGYSSSGSDDESSENEQDNQMVDYKDEFGRTRKGTRAEVMRQERRTQRSALGVAELERMAAKPIVTPSNLIFGDAIQSAAFDPENQEDGARVRRMRDLAERRDKSPTPPEDTHFDGAAEIRTKGVGFYQFSRDNEARQMEMESLEAERKRTEQVREERLREKERRRKEIEDRRVKIERKRAEKLAVNFLDGLAGEMSATIGGSPDTRETADAKGGGV